MLLILAVVMIGISVAFYTAGWNPEFVLSAFFSGIGLSLVGLVGLVG